MDISNNIISYAGFTIGPIGETLRHTKKTREIWFASFFFSWYMEILLADITENKAIKCLTPFVPKPFKENKTRAGFFPDRFVLASELSLEETYSIIEKANSQALEFFVSMIDDLVEQEGLTKTGKYSKEQTREILKDYIQSDFVVIPVEDIQPSAPVQNIDFYLNALEENRSFCTGKSEHTCYRCKTLPGIVMIEDKYDERQKRQSRCPLCLLKTRCNNSSDIIERAGKAGQLYYPSTRDISAAEFVHKIRTTSELENYKKTRKDGEIDLHDDEFRKIANIPLKSELKKANKPDVVKPYHNYFAIFQADGDKLGDLAKSCNKPEELSEKLFNFSRAAIETVSRYKGEPIYFGGDDILAFMPTAFRNGNGKLFTIFDFALEISQLYSNMIGTDKAKATISMGVNISYYKYPQAQALQEAGGLLFNYAKKKRNSLFLNLIQHSGQTTKIGFEFSSEQIITFASLFNGVLNENVKIPHTLHHNLARFQTVLTSINTVERLEAFFANSFNEEIHQNQAVAEGLESVRNLLKISLALKNNEERKSSFESVLKQLKFLDFFRDDKNI